MVQTSLNSITLNEFLLLPETKPASEFIDGQIIQKPMPQGEQSRIQQKLTTAINAVVEDLRIALALPELRCTNGRRSIVPDIAVFTWERIPTNPGGTIANAFESHPDWSIEILSPEQSSTKTTKQNSAQSQAWLSHGMAYRSSGTLHPALSSRTAARTV